MSGLLVWWLLLNDFVALPIILIFVHPLLRYFMVLEHPLSLTLNCGLNPFD
jgi:hypothetical protein